MRGGSVSLAEPRPVTITYGAVTVTLAPVYVNV
jgi:hypothetical protein